MPFDDKNQWYPSEKAAEWHYQFKANVAKRLGLPESQYPGGYDMVVLLDAIDKLKNAYRR